LVHASEGRAVLRFFSGGATQPGALCVVGAEAGARPRCLFPGYLAPGRYPLAGAALRGDRLYLSVAHVAAHNLDDRPDSWLLAYDLETGRVVGRTPPLTASIGPVDAGALLATGFGITGAADWLYLVDPIDLRRVRMVSLRTAPRQIVAGPSRVYVATYDGRVAAIELPLPGPPALEEAVVQPAPRTAGPGAPKGLFGWKVERVIDAHPERGRTSGQDTEDAAAESRRGALHAPANRFRRCEACRYLRISPRIRALNSAGGHAHRLVALSAAASEGTVGAVAFLPGGRLAAAGNDDRVRVFDLASGARLARGPRLGKDVVGLSACAGGGYLARVYGGKRRRFGADHRPGAVDCAVEAPDAPPITEDCGPEACVVGIGTRLLRFDTRGAVWSPTVPSTLDLSPDGRFLLLHRDGLEALLVRVADGARRALGVVPRTMSATPGLRFDGEGRRFVVTMAPRSHQVTVYARPTP